jgi:competence protein ComEC
LNAIGENKQIDYVVATHPHEDHIGGMSTILNDYTIGTFFDSGYPHTTVTYTNMLKAIDKKGIVFTTPHNNDIIDFDPSVKTMVLNPNDGKKYDTINDYSVVIKMTYRNVSFLFMGDAQEDVEKILISRGYNLDSTVLKVGHHGSDTSSGIIFLQKVDPEVSVIEVGRDNSYGHPKQTTLGKLALVGSDIYRTDQDGIITITTNGDTYSIITSK